MDIFRFVSPVPNCGSKSAGEITEGAATVSATATETECRRDDDDDLKDAVALQNLVRRIKRDAKAIKQGDDGPPLTETLDSRKRMREYQRARRAKMSAEQKEEQRARQREYTRAYRARMSPTRKQAMQAKRREAHRRAKAAREAEEAAIMTKDGALNKPERLMVHHWMLPKAPKAALAPMSVGQMPMPQYIATAPKNQSGDMTMITKRLGPSYQQQPGCRNVGSHHA